MHSNVFIIIISSIFLFVSPSFSPLLARSREPYSVTEIMCCMQFFAKIDVTLHHFIPMQHKLTNCKQFAEHSPRSIKNRLKYQCSKFEIQNDVFSYI